MGIFEIDISVRQDTKDLVESRGSSSVFCVVLYDIEINENLLSFVHRSLRTQNTFNLVIEG